MKTDSKTTVKKEFNGWQASTLESFGGYDWKISTRKGNGGAINCSAQAGKSVRKNGYSTFTFTMFQDPRKNLYKDFARATEKAIRETHTRGLIEFDRLKEAGELPENPNATPS